MLDEALCFQAGDTLAPGLDLADRLYVPQDVLEDPGGRRAVGDIGLYWNRGGLQAKDCCYSFASETPGHTGLCDQQGHFRLTSLRPSPHYLQLHSFPQEAFPWQELSQGPAWKI